MMFMDYFRVFEFDFWKKGRNKKKSGQAVEVLRCSIETHAMVKAHAMPQHGMPCHGVAEWEAGQASGSSRCRAELRHNEELRIGEATVHNTEISVFCLFCFRCSEDSSIGLIRIL